MSELDRQLYDVIEGSLAPLDVDAIVARRRRRRRVRRATAAAAVVLVVAGGTAGVWSLRSNSSAPVAAVRVEPRDTAIATRSALTQTLLMSGGGGSGALGSALTSLTVVDPATGATHEVPLPLPSAQSSLYPYIVRGSSFVVVLDSQTGATDPAIGTAYAVPSTLSTAVTLGRASYAFAALTPNRVWLASDNATPQQRLDGTEYGTVRTVVEVGLDGRRTSPVYPLSDQRSPIAEVDGGLLTSRPGAKTADPSILEVWDPAANRVVRRVAAANIVVAAGAYVAWTDAGCELQCGVHVTDARSGTVRAFAPPPGLDWEASVGEGASISPDGRSLALIARPRPTPAENGRDSLEPERGSAPAVVAVIDLTTGARRERHVTAWRGGMTLGWSPDSALLFFAQDQSHVAYLSAADVADTPGALPVIKIASADAYFAVGRATPPAPGAAQRYQVDIRVEQDATHGPELCVYAARATEALPDFGSGCSGPRITNWDWNRAPHPTRTAGTTSGQYHLVGTYDGTAFTLTQPPTTTTTTSSADPVDEPVPAPCPTPPGGWQSTSPAHGLTDYQGLQSAAQNAPDFAGMWVSSTIGTGPADDFQKNAVTVVAFTGDTDAHRRQLAALWGGPICVVQRPHSHIQLQAVVDRINTGDTDRTLGVQSLSDGVDDVRDVVDLGVIAATPATQREMDRRFGPGLVLVNSLMKPVP